MGIQRLRQGGLKVQLTYNSSPFLSGTPGRCSLGQSLLVTRDEPEHLQCLGPLALVKGL